MNVRLSFRAGYQVLFSSRSGLVCDGATLTVFARSAFDPVQAVEIPLDRRVDLPLADIARIEFDEEGAWP